MEGLDYIIEHTIPPAEAIIDNMPIVKPSQICKGGISLLNPKYAIAIKTEIDVSKVNKAITALWSWRAHDLYLKK